MRVIPVLDLMHGQVVRGIAGRRQEYQPVQSQLVGSADPMVVARAFRDHFGLTELYLADLDAIAGSPSAISLFTSLQSDGFKLLVDSGLRSAPDAEPLISAGVSGIVAGLETLTNLEVVAELLLLLEHHRLVFSLDLKDGKPLIASANSTRDDLWTIASQAVALGVRRVLVLDLARVGLGKGTGTEEFCARLKKEHTDVEVLAGGGVRGSDDLDKLRDCGVDGVLVASALHDGRLRPEDLY